MQPAVAVETPPQELPPDDLPAWAYAVFRAINLLNRVGGGTIRMTPHYGKWEYGYTEDYTP